MLKDPSLRGEMQHNIGTALKFIASIILHVYAPSSP